MIINIVYIIACCFFSKRAFLALTPSSDVRRATAIGVLLRMPYYSVLRFKVYAEKLVNKIKIKSEVRKEKRCIVFVCVFRF